MLTSTVCVALSGAGLAAALLTAYRRRLLLATRIAAFALVPVGLAMAGLTDLGKDVGVAVGRWSTGLVLKPTVWAGFGILGLAVLLFLVARIAKRRSGPATGQGGSRAEAAAVAPRASAPELGSAGRPAAGADKGRSGAAGLEDFQDIEDILKKHGI
ncbi:hypothetical protein [Streptomyces sp. TP-A0874]|uniref:hypothetical protein n=1 Tax=Streptomyces sp. TP-A0874 TaxID=549819 RepID=UPI000852F7AF|nr:hypothetical protein [Streptomyces sp. TP-A0874]